MTNVSASNPASPVADVTGPNLKSIKQLSEQYPIPESTWRWFKHTGRGPRAYKIGRRLYFDEQDVIEWLKAHREDAAA